MIKVMDLKASELHPDLISRRVKKSKPVKRKKVQVTLTSLETKKVKIFMMLKYL